jgi:hypothetical protein
MVILPPLLQLQHYGLMGLVDLSAAKRLLQRPPDSPLTSCNSSDKGQKKRKPEKLEKEKSNKGHCLTNAAFFQKNHTRFGKIPLPFPFHPPKPQGRVEKG